MDSLLRRLVIRVFVDSVLLHRLWPCHRRPDRSFRVVRVLAAIDRWLTANDGVYALNKRAFRLSFSLGSRAPQGMTSSCPSH
jgi:hypothetical protein